MVRGVIVFPECWWLSRRAYVLKLVFVSIVFAAQLFAVGCDPGMLIQQVKAPTPAGAGTPEQDLKLVVGTTNRLIGERLYNPLVDAINVGRSPVRVVKVELHTQNKIYTNDSTAPNGDGHPLVIDPGETKPIPVQFWVENSVWDTFFRHPADLVVYYEDGSKQRMAHATIVGVHLDGSR